MQITTKIALTFLVIILIILNILSLYIEGFTILLLLLGGATIGPPKGILSIISSIFDIAYGAGYIFILLYCVGHSLYLIKKKSIRSGIIILTIPLCITLLYLTMVFITENPKSFGYTPTKTDYVCYPNRIITVTTSELGAFDDPLSKLNYERRFEDVQYKGFLSNLIQTFFLLDFSSADTNRYNNYSDLKNALTSEGINIQQCKNSTGQSVPSDTQPTSQDYICSSNIFVIAGADNASLPADLYEVRVVNASGNVEKYKFKSYNDTTNFLQDNKIDVNACKNQKGLVLIIASQS